MPFRDALWDGSDPAYAPGLNWTGKHPYWRPTRKYLAAGYSIKVIRLPGEKGDGRDMERAALCRKHTQEMVSWLSGDQGALREGTWKWIIARYLGDETSPIREVKANTAASYREDVAYWEEAIGKSRLSDCNHAMIIGWRNTMRDVKGRKDAFIKRKFGALRRVVKYGAQIECAECQRIHGILSLMRIKGSKPRKVAPTPAQIDAIIKKADEIGYKAFATGLLIQWWFTLRAVDVRGQWLDLRPGEPDSGIVRGRKRWADGITWDMIDRDVTVLAKAPSKTVAFDPEPLRLELTLVPEIRNRLLEIPADERVGPVITNRQGVPYTPSAWAHMFRKCARAVGVPDDIWMMDTRAGAITDARLKGAAPYDLRDAAGHSQLSTTDRYTRDRSAGSANVLRLRVGQKNNDTTS